MVKTSPKVSVVMSVYNESRYISVAIKSILNQTFNDFEFLIIDDGSSDKTPEIIEHYAEKDDRIRYIINETNKGLPASLNKGVEAANGEYIARMDADDKSLPKRFERQVEFLETNPDVHVVGCNVHIIGRNGEYLGDRKFPHKGRDPETLQKQGAQIVHPSVMMRRTSVQTVNGYRPAFKHAQDVDLWVRMARKYGPQFAYVLPQILFEYRITPQTYRRTQIAPIYASYAGEPDRGAPPLDERIAQTIEQRREKASLTKAKSMYQYTAARLLLDRDQRLQAGRRFLSAVTTSPTNIRAWCGFGLLMLPSSLRDRIITTKRSL